VASPDDFAASLRAVLAMFDTIAESLTAARSPLDSATGVLTTALAGSTRPEAEGAVTALVDAGECLTKASAALANGAQELVAYADVVLGDAAAPPLQPPPSTTTTATVRPHPSPTIGLAEVPDIPQKPPASRPPVSDPKLSNLVDNLYKGVHSHGRTGDGSTMDAIRNEIRTGRPTSGKFHVTKGRESLRGLQNWLRRNPGASDADRSAAENLIDQLHDALGGR
jgi:hypothetical protein